MQYLISLHQHEDGIIDLTIHKSGKRYLQQLDEGQAATLAYKLMSFAASQQDRPFFLLGD